MIDVTVWVPARSAIVAVRIGAVLRNRQMPRTSDPDPHAWLRPYYGRLQSIHAFNLLSPAHQFEQLRQAVAPEHPVEAEQMREWSPAAQTALMVNLAKVVPTASVAVTCTLAPSQRFARDPVCRAIHVKRYRSAPARRQGFSSDAVVSFCNGRQHPCRAVAARPPRKRMELGL